MSNPNLRDREIYNREVERDRQIVRENDSTANGLIIGILLTGLVALGVAFYYLTNQKPAAQGPSRTTVIEKTKEVPVPQPTVPDIKISVPSQPTNPAPSQPTETAPAPQAPTSTAPQQPTNTAPAAAPSQSAPAQSSGSNAPASGSAPSNP